MIVFVELINFSYGPSGVLPGGGGGGGLFWTQGGGGGYNCSRNHVINVYTCQALIISPYAIYSSAVERFSQKDHPVSGTSSLKSDLLPCEFFPVPQQVALRDKQ